MNELKDEVCSYWFAPVGSASDYPLLSKWVIYGEVQVEKVNDFSHHFVFLCYLLYHCYNSVVNLSYIYLFITISISQLACNGSCDGSSDGISPLYSLWATFIGLYIANYVVERSTG